MKEVLTYYEINKEKILARQKEYYKNNREKLLANQKARYAANPEYYKEYAEKNKEHIKTRYKEWVAKNKDKVNQYSYNQQKKAFERDPDKVREARQRNKARQKAKNPERYNMMANKWNRKTGKASVSELRDCYIKQLLCKHAVVKRLSAKDIPQEMIEVKRLEIKIRRELNEKRN
jgi:hypothetical protein